jgi:hypothetical protein
MNAVLRRIIAAGVLAAAFTVYASAQTPRLLTNESEIEQFETLFLGSFLIGDFEEAFDVFRIPASALSAGEINNLEASTSSQLANIEDSYGDALDSRLARRREVPGLLLRREYLLRFEFLPLRAEFVYYFDGATWRLTYFGWDDNFASLLED